MSLEEKILILSKIFIVKLSHIDIARLHKISLASVSYLKKKLKNNSKYIEELMTHEFQIAEAYD